jgi:hypothetical protein
MKHVSTYLDFLYEGKKQYIYNVKESKGFNVFDLLNELKKLNAEILNNSPGKAGETILTIVMNESSKKKVEETLKKTSEILQIS